MRHKVVVVAYSTSSSDAYDIHTYVYYTQTLLTQDSHSKILLLSAYTHFR